MRVIPARLERGNWVFSLGGRRFQMDAAYLRFKRAVSASGLDEVAVVAIGFIL
jgi:hypothetical protein